LAGPQQVIDLRPVYDRKEQRIRAHVILCWLALPLTRTVEATCGGTWPRCAASSFARATNSGIRGRTSSRPRSADDQERVCRE
jgi:hypothetical protein